MLSKIAIADIASITGTARGVMHESCLPSILILTFSLVCKFMVSCSFAIEGVGFITTLKVIGIPFAIPPLIPPLLLVFVDTTLPSVTRASFTSEP